MVQIVLMGSGGVGKSALVIRLTTEQFVSSHDPTIEDQYHFPTTVDGVEASLDILVSGSIAQLGALQHAAMYSTWRAAPSSKMLVSSLVSTLFLCPRLGPGHGWPGGVQRDARPMDPGGPRIFDPVQR